MRGLDARSGNHHQSMAAVPYGAPPSWAVYGEDPRNEKTSRGKKTILECGGKRSATPLSEPIRQAQTSRKAESTSDLCQRTL
jgi:hypothetical protein